jgi:hypothetical protein
MERLAVGAVPATHCQLPLSCDSWASSQSEAIERPSHCRIDHLTGGTASLAGVPLRDRYSIIGAW